MNLCWKNCLGLHNKPIKAEVRPEHMLTGSKEEEEATYNNAKVSEAFSASSQKYLVPICCSV